MLKVYFLSLIFEIFKKQNMHHLLSKVLTETKGELLSSWEVTPKAIVFALTWSLQARDWEGKQLWTVDIE